MTERHETGIQWTHVPGYIGATWNPTTGCTRVSPGCDNCYAFTLHDQRYKVNRKAARAVLTEEVPGDLSASAYEAWRKSGETDAQLVRRSPDAAALPLAPQYDVPFSKVQMLGEDRLTEPLRKQKPHAYFVDSMSDLFHEDVPDEFLDRVFAVMALSPQHLFMILTKRPERMREYLTRLDHEVEVWEVSQMFASTLPKNHPGVGFLLYGWTNSPRPLPNVWLGVTAEDQQRADERIPILLDTPAAVRFVSYEPALGPVDFGYFVEDFGDGYEVDSNETIDWIIVGGESGSHARPFDLAWARSVVAQGAAAGVPVFVKQMGSQPVGGTRRVPWGRGYPSGQAAMTYRDEPAPLKLRSRHGSDPAEWPEDLRVRQWPEVQR